MYLKGIFIFQQGGNTFPFVQKSEPKGNPKIGQHSAIMQSSLAGNSLAKATDRENAFLRGGALLPHDLCGLHLL